jgi:hypothetical protein
MFLSHQVVLEGKGSFVRILLAIFISKGAHLLIMSIINDLLTLFNFKSSSAMH